MTKLIWRPRFWWTFRTTRRDVAQAYELAQLAEAGREIDAYLDGAL